MVRISFLHSSRSELSKAPSGSSNNNMSGLLMIALASATRCCSPPDNVSTEVFLYLYIWSIRIMLCTSFSMVCLG